MMPQTDDTGGNSIRVLTESIILTYCLLKFLFSHCFVRFSIIFYQHGNIRYFRKKKPVSSFYSLFSIVEMEKIVDEWWFCNANKFVLILKGSQ